MSPPTESAQARFARHWGQLSNPHVRALAWLLDSPDLLDLGAPPWHGQVGNLAPLGERETGWLLAQERDPAGLLAALAGRPTSRLGLYAENLMAYFFSQQGMLVAHGLQVRARHDDTVGEFDFLLAGAGGQLDHWELATKFYLFDDAAAGAGFDAFVGPNLADSLGNKMRKIVQRQLALSRHPAAQAVLPAPVGQARALVKGWLFYRHGEAAPMAGIGLAHCHGFWCELEEVDQVVGGECVVLPRLQWLAPYRGSASEVMEVPQLQQWLRDYFAQARTPVLLAQVAALGDGVVETARGFVVPPGWRQRAAALRAGS